MSTPRLTQKKIKELLAPRYCECREPRSLVESVQNWATRQWERLCSSCGFRRRSK